MNKLSEEVGKNKIETYKTLKKINELLESLPSNKELELNRVYGYTRDKPELKVEGYAREICYKIKAKEVIDI